MAFDLRTPLDLLGFPGSARRSDISGRIVGVGTLSDAGFSASATMRLMTQVQFFGLCLLVGVVVTAAAFIAMQSAQW